jgi:hypothetical protein
MVTSNMMILELDFRLLVVFDKRYSLSEFRVASRVAPGSYADELVERIHDCLFKYPRDVYAEYKKYYAVEYPDFAEFLYWKYKVDKAIALRIRDRVSNNVFVGYGRDSIGMFGDETLASVLKRILSELGEEENENTG